MDNKTYHKDNLKIKILDYAIKCIKNKGYKSVSIRKIATVLDVSPTAIYRHYANLEDLLRESVVLMSQEFVDYLKIAGENEKLETSVKEIEVIGYHFVNYAVVFKNEFEFLFLSEYSLKRVSLEKDKEYPLISLMDLIIEKVIKVNNLNINKNILFNQLWCFIFGYAVLVSKDEIKLERQLINFTVKNLLRNEME